MRNNLGLVSAGFLAIALALTGCLDGTGGTATNPGSTRANQPVERDIEAPEVFSKRDRALWDGRPSLGGVWVAHPDVRTPERVIIRNTETGRETIGALFRRERMNPGPIFQVSADAAAAVGMLAGAPTGIEVIALRTEEVRPVAVAVANVEPAAPVTPAPAATPEQVVAVAAARPSDAATTTGTALPQIAAAPADETMIALPDADAPAPRAGLFSRLFGGRAQSTEPTQVAAIDTQALPEMSVASAAQDVSLRMPTPITDAAPPADAPMPPASTLAQPFVQLGIFSVEANARRAEKMARDSGLSARVIKGQTQGNDFWRVTVGPATTAVEQRDLLSRVKSLGFNDAYTVRR